MRVNSGKGKTLKTVCMKVSFFMSKDLKPQIGTHFSRRGITITVYKHSKSLLNVTGIKDQDHLKETQKFVQAYYLSVNNSVLVGVRIDNIMFSRKMFNNYDMTSILNFCRKSFSHSHYIEYDDERLTSKGIFLKPRIKPNCSFILYRTGSTTILGGKQISDIHQCQLIIDRIYQNCCLKKKVT